MGGGCRRGGKIWRRRALLFDLDGTLIEMRDTHWRALNKALDRVCSHPGISYQDHLARFDGLPTKVKLDMLGIPQELREQVQWVKQRETLREIHKHCQPDWRLNAALNRLRKDGFFIGVVSNARRETCMAMFWKAKLGLYVKLLLSGDEGKPKPHPDLYLKAKTLLKCPSMAIEDNHHGIAAAVAAGIPYMKVSGPQDISYESVMRNWNQLEAMAVV